MGSVDLRVARGGSGAKVPPLAARPKQTHIRNVREGR